mgnify:FL=1
MSIAGIISAINMFTAIAQKKSKARTFGIWFNGSAFVLIIIALIIALSRH